MKLTKIAALVTFSNLLFSIAHAIPFTIVPLSGTSLPTISFPNTVVQAYYSVTNNTSKTLVDNFVKFLPPNVTQNIYDPLVTNLCGPRFNLTPNGTAGDTCTLSLNVAGPVYANDTNPFHHLFVCLSGGATCAGTQSPLAVGVVNNSYLYQRYFYQFPIADSLLPSGQNPFFGNLGNVTVKRCDQPDNIYIDSKNLAANPNTRSCRWGDYNTGVNFGRTNMQILVHVSADITALHASCVFTTPVTSRITGVMVSKSGALPIPDPSSGNGLSAGIEILPIASTTPNLLPSPNPQLIAQGQTQESIEVSFPNYNTWQSVIPQIQGVSSQIDTVYIINNNSGSFNVNDTITCVFTPEFG